MRYLRIIRTFWRNSLIREMTFRWHFIINAAAELGWIVMMLIFIEVIYANTGDVRGWTHHQYLFLTGTHLLITSIFEAFFWGNCWRVSELVRTGNLDFVLVRPANAQFLLSFERLDYSSFANIPAALGICGYALISSGQSVTLGQGLLYGVLIFGGVMILYALLFMFAITSVWLIRQTGIEGLWFYTVSLARYPAEIYRRFLGGVLFFFLVFVVPVLMVSNLPANVMVRTFEPRMVVHVLLAGLALLALSTVVMRLALRWYRSASS